MTLHTNSLIWLPILLACATGCHTSAAKEGISMPGTVGSKAPDVSLHLHDGSTVKLSDFEKPTRLYALAKPVLSETPTRT